MAIIGSLKFLSGNRHLLFESKVGIGAKETCDTPGPCCTSGSSSEPVTASM
jgi:hypothetical protein